jgi:CDP-paratose 2-epimerase
VFWLASHFWKKKLSYFGYGGKGKQIRDILHIDDLADFIDVHLHQFDCLSGKTMNLGGGVQNSLSLQELTALCEEITGNKIKVDSVAENRVADIPYYVTDNHRVSELMNWTPRKSIQTILKDTFSWMRENERQLKQILG